MAYDQNSINVVRNVAEETRIAAATSSGRPIEGFYAVPPRDGGPGTGPAVYYTPAMADGGFVGLGYNNGMSGWVPPAQPQVGNPGNGFRHMPSFGGRSNGSDQTSDEGVDESGSGKKVKFLCSFGGKILPRPSDGASRYVGGQTRIISVRRGVSFDKLVGKMVDIYGENVVVKYQLPEEDLDALVSVSCPDDLDNMMDEYEKLSKRTPDGSAKIRVFLFSASEVDSSGTTQFPDMRDSGQKYFEAVNGLLEGVSSNAMKETTASAAFSGVDAIDNSGQSSGESSVHLPEATSKSARLDQGIPVMTGPPPTMPINMDDEIERSSPMIMARNYGMELQPPGMTSPVSSPSQETMTRTEYVRYPSHLGYPPHIMRTITPVIQQQHIAPGASPNQFIPAVNVTLPPTSHVNAKMFPGLIQPQQFQRVVQVPVSYSPYQAQVTPMKHQIRQDHVSNRPAGGDPPPSLLSDNRIYEQPVHYYSNISSVVPKVDNQESYGAYDHQRLMQREMENLQIHPSEIMTNNGQNMLAADILKRENIQENRLPSGEGEPSRHTNFEHQNTALGGSLINQIEMLAVSAPESPFINNEVAQSLFTSDPRMHSHAKPDSYTVHDEIYSAPPQPQLYGVGDGDHSSNSLFSHQDPWNFQQDTHFPPPRPKLIQLKKEASDTKVTAGVTRQMSDKESQVSTSGAFITERWLEDVSNQVSGNVNSDANSECAQSKKGSAEEYIKQELQAVAEGVAASVLQSPTVTQESTDLQEFEATRPQKMNLGSPLSEGIGRLQIINNTDLEEYRELGSGTFGTVYHGKWRGTDVAIKRINDRCFAGKPSEQDRMRDDFWNEAIKLADLHHPNVVAFYGLVLDGPGGSVATVTEYMVNGSLKTALQKNERSVDKRKRLLIAMDVAFGMEYLHGKNIVHFDLKSDNLLVNLRDPQRPICKVGDLGLSKVKCQTLISGGVRGTLPWMAPELLNGSSSLVSEKVDVYSFGIVLWELLTGEEPYIDLHYGAIIGGIVSNTLRPLIPETCDPDWRSLMERCWSSEPTERPNFTEIANDLRAMSSKLPAKGHMQQQSQPKALS